MIPSRRLNVVQFVFGCVSLNVVVVVVMTAVKIGSQSTDYDWENHLHSCLAEAENFQPPSEIFTVRWFCVFIVQYITPGVYNSWKSWKSPGMLLMLLENVIVSSNMIICRSLNLIWLHL